MPNIDQFSMNPCASRLIDITIKKTTHFQWADVADVADGHDVEDADDDEDDDATFDDDDDVDD